MSSKDNDVVVLTKDDTRGSTLFYEGDNPNAVVADLSVHDLRAAVAAVVAFVDHRGFCPRRDARSTWACACGLDAALARIEAATR